MEKKKEHICEECEQEFRSARNLRYHQECGNCRPDRKFLCIDCKHNYASKQTYDRHICRAAVQRALTYMRKEAIRKGRTDAKGKIPTDYEIYGVVDIVGNRFLTMKAILSIALDTTWYEKASEDSDDETSDNDSESDITEDGGETDFDDEDERSALTAAYEASESTRGKEWFEWADSQERSLNDQSRTARTEDNSDASNDSYEGTSKTESDSGMDSSKYSETGGHAPASRKPQTGRKLTNEERIALLKKKIAILEKEEEEERKEREEREESEESEESDENMESFRSNEGSKKNYSQNVEIGFPNEIISKNVERSALSEKDSTSEDSDNDHNDYDDENNDHDQDHDQDHDHNEDDDNDKEEVEQVTKENKTDLSREVQKGEKAENGEKIADKSQKASWSSALMYRQLNQDNKAHRYPDNIIIPSKKEKHYYESENSDEEAGYVVKINEDDDDYSEDGPNEIYVLSKEDLARQKEGWIPSFEYKGQSLNRIIELLNRKAEEEKKSGKYLMHPMSLKKNLLDQDDDSLNLDNAILEVPVIASGHYINTVHAMMRNTEMYQTLLYIRTLGSATDYIEADFRLIKKIYLDGHKKSEMPIKITDIRRNKLEFLNAKKVWVTDFKGSKLGKILCDNLIDTYTLTNIKLTNVITDLNNRKEKIQLLELYQINKTQQHIQKLTDTKTQSKLAKRISEFIYHLSEDEIVEATTKSSKNNEPEIHN